MHTIETITKGGKRFAVLPLAKYEEILEDIEDLKMLPKLEALSEAYTHGEIEGLPSSFCEKLAEAGTTGELIALWREYRGLSRAALGEAIGSTGQYVGMIESGKREGTLVTINAITKALRCNLDDLLPR